MQHLGALVPGVQRLRALVPGVQRLRALVPGVQRHVLSSCQRHRHFLDCPRKFRLRPLLGKMKKGPINEKRARKISATPPPTTPPPTESRRLGTSHERGPLFRKILDLRLYGHRPLFLPHLAICCRFHRVNAGNNFLDWHRETESDKRGVCFGAFIS